MRMFIAQSHIWQWVLGRLMECHSQTPLRCRIYRSWDVRMSSGGCGQTNVWLRLPAIQRCITGNVSIEISILEASWLGTSDVSIKSQRQMRHRWRHVFRLVLLKHKLYCDASQNYVTKWLRSTPTEFYSESRNLKGKLGWRMKSLSGKLYNRRKIIKPADF